jgi:hypothetical protein
MRSLRSTLVLIVILGGLVGYIYYLNKDQSSGTDTKEKAFASLKAEDIEDVQIKAADGQTSRSRKPTAGGKSRHLKKHPLTRESCRRSRTASQRSTFNEWSMRMPAT